MNLLFLGKPGSGKGTITKRLEGDFVFLSTGDLLRAEVKTGSPRGVEIGNLLKQGKFASDDVIFDIVEDFLKTNKDKSIIFDGFPRNLLQANECVKRGIEFDKIFHIVVDDKEVEERIVNRRIHMASGRVYNISTLPPKVEGLDDITGEPLTHRDDDKQEVVKERLEIYRNVTEPIIKFLEDRGETILEIDGNMPLPSQLKLVQAEVNNIAKPSTSKPKLR